MPVHKVYDVLAPLNFAYFPEIQRFELEGQAEREVGGLRKVHYKVRKKGRKKGRKRKGKRRESSRQAGSISAAAAFRSAPCVRKGKERLDTFS